MRFLKVIYKSKYTIGFPGQFRRFVIPFDLKGVIQIREINLCHEIRNSNCISVIQILRFKIYFWLT